MLLLSRFRESEQKNHHSMRNRLTRKGANYNFSKIIQENHSLTLIYNEKTSLYVC